jgi:glycosyltransferase involved in cell wall biosynthesis
VDIFRGEDVGVMVEGGAPEFAAAIIDLLRDDRRRFDLGLRGYELVRRSYSLQAMGERYYRFYHQILAS